MRIILIKRDEIGNCIPTELAVQEIRGTVIILMFIRNCSTFC